MKMLIVSLVLLSPVYAEENPHSCDFEGSKWSAERKFNSACSENQESFTCNPVVEGDSIVDRELATCQCTMDQSEFIQQHNKLMEFKYTGNIEGIDAPKNLDTYERRKYVDAEIKKLCHPFKAVQIIQDGRSALAIYEYKYTREKGWACLPRIARYNGLGGAKFNFPGSTNDSPILKSLIGIAAHTISVAGQTGFRGNLEQTLRLSLATYRYNGPYNPTYLVEDNSKPGVINCSGAYSELLEKREAQQRVEKRKLAEEAAQKAQEERNPSGDKTPTASQSSTTIGSGTQE